MSYKEKINNLEPVEFSNYKSLTSYEKYMAYTALVLEENNIPLTFNYLCIAAFKLFPKKFCVDDEFREFPSVDRLNRTMMHMKYQKGKPSYLTGTTKQGYSLTPLGRQTAEMVKAIIKGPESVEISKNNQDDNVDGHKEGYGKYKKFLKDDCFKKYVNTGVIDNVGVFVFFDLAPFSEISYVRNTMESWLENYCKDNPKCEEFINKFLSNLPKS